MNHFDYRNGEMFAENVPLKRIAQEVGTPAYVYSLATLKRHYSVFDQAFAINQAPAFENDIRSEHPGGGNFCVGDGTVRFVADSINIATYRAMATIRGGESVSPNSSLQMSAKVRMSSVSSCMLDTVADHAAPA